MQKRVDDFANYLSTTGLQAEPVLLFHNHHEGINALEDEICKRQPDHYYRLENERHELWILSEAQEQQLQDYCKSFVPFPFGRWASPITKHASMGGKRGGSTAPLVLCDFKERSLEREFYMGA